MTAVASAPSREDVQHTARGVLRHDADRITRVIDPRLCDEGFRAELTQLRTRRHPRTLTIVADGPSPEGYRIEYAVPTAYRTLGAELSARSRWTDRLLLLVAVCESVDIWHGSALSSLGLDPYSVVVVADGGATTAWLAPCPPVRLSSPRDLLGIDETSLAVTAPEVVRGLVALGPAEDAYALGTLVALAVGCGFSPWVGETEQLEAQARGALLGTDASASRVESVLHRLAHIEALFTTIRRYRDLSADARPAGTRELRRTLIAAADLARLARDLRRTDPVTALAVLSWDALRSPDDRISHHRLAADICAQAGDLDAALDHLDRAVALTPAHVQVRGERCELLWRRWNQQSDVRDRTGPLLLEDLAFLHPHDTRGGGTLWLREAYVRKHAGDLAGALRALFAAGKRDQSDLTILLESGRCWRELNSRDSDANVAVIKALALHRIPTLVATGSLAEGDVQRWLDDFDAI